MQSLPVRVKSRGTKALCEALGVGEPTLMDIVSELCKPGRDVRDSLPKPLLRSDVMGLEDLKPGMELKGTVRICRYRRASGRTGACFPDQ